MQGGGNRHKSVSFKGESENNNSIDHRQRSSFRDREAYNERDQGEERHVKLLPDANMTISVHNDFRDTCLRGNRSILKSNNFRDDTNLSYNDDRNSHPSNRNYEPFRGRGGRGKSRGFYNGSNANNYDNHYDINNHKGGRGRPMSGNYGDYSYEKGQDYSNRGGRGRQSSESQEYEYDRGHDMQFRGGKGRQSQRSYNADTSGNKDLPQEGQASYRGRSKSANDKPRFRPKNNRGRNRGKTSNGTDTTVSADGDKTGEQVTKDEVQVTKDEVQVTKDEVQVSEEVPPVNENHETKVEEDPEHQQVVDGQQQPEVPVETVQTESVEEKTEEPVHSDATITTTTAVTVDQ